MNNIKQGSWVVEKSNNELKQVTIGKHESIEHKLALYKRLCVLWEPKQDTYNWFWNNSLHQQYPLLAMFEKMNTDGTYETDIGKFDNCEPFIGELPTLIKE